MHAPYILSTDDLGDSLEFYRRPPILEADDLLGACYRKAMTPKSYGLYFFPKRAQVCKRAQKGVKIANHQV